MADTTTIRLPPQLRVRLAALAKQGDRSVHSLIVEAVERYAAYEEALRALVREALAADRGLERVREVYAAADVDAWLARLAAGEGSPAPWQP
ncbi:MAG: CopG family transcriptional regulator [Proteobacteria bacterium]|nr:CopG family transcriptional regulator [Pseudomonadota bacterium]